jgi:hypothetical protein
MANLIYELWHHTTNTYGNHYVSDLSAYGGGPCKDNVVLDKFLREFEAAHQDHLRSWSEMGADFSKEEISEDIMHTIHEFAETRENAPSLLPLNDLILCPSWGLDTDSEYWN